MKLKMTDRKVLCFTFVRYLFVCLFTEKIFASQIPRCSKCEDVVKPGEDFFQLFLV